MSTLAFRRNSLIPTVIRVVAQPADDQADNTGGSTEGSRKGEGGQGRLRAARREGNSGRPLNSRPHNPWAVPTGRPLPFKTPKKLPQAARWGYVEGSEFIGARISPWHQGGREEAPGKHGIGDRRPGLGLVGGQCQ